MSSAARAISDQYTLLPLISAFLEKRGNIKGFCIRFQISEHNIGVVLFINMRRRYGRSLIEVYAIIQNSDKTSAFTTILPFSSLHAIEHQAAKIGNISIDPKGTFGSIKDSSAVGSFSWDFALDPQEPIIDPQVFGVFQPFDLRMMSEMALISGSVTMASQRISFSGESAVVSVYYGRRLPAQWMWLTMNDITRTGYAIDFVFFRSHIFGAPFLQFDVGYLLLRTPESAELVMAPLTGEVTVKEQNDQIEIITKKYKKHIGAITFSVGEKGMTILPDNVHVNIFAQGSIGAVQLENKMIVLKKV